MSQGELGARPLGPITIDQLLALNEEIAALVRAGVPLERGLLVAGRGHPKTNWAGSLQLSVNG